MGLVLLGAAAAEAQTERILVSNTAVGNDDTANTSGNDHAQLFHTGANAAGYTLTSVVVNSDDVEDDDFDVEICGADTTADEFPTTNCTALTAPASFVGVGNPVFTHTGLTLSANTNYVVVIKQRGTGSVRLKSTTNTGEDTSLGLSGWSIKNKFYWKSGSTWMIKSGSNEALRIIVNGYELVFAVDADDATLSALSVSGATLSPAFAAATTTYQAVVANSVSQVTITETKSESTATVEYLDGSDATRTDADIMTPGLQVNLSVGTNTVKVKVTAPDATTTKTYTVNVLRGDTTPPSLESATVLAANAGATIELVFDENYRLLGVAALPLAAFSVTADGNSVTIGSFGVVRETNGTYKRYRLFGLSPTITYGQAVIVSYTDPTTGDDTTAIEDAAGNDVASFTTGSGGVPAVINNLPPPPPDVSSVEITSLSVDATNGIGLLIEATVTFSAAVDITGSPQLELDFAGTAKAAACTAATNTTTMVCGYRVAVGDVAAGGVAIAANKLTLNGGTITATGSTTVNADLDHGAVLIDANHKVDGIRPTLVTTGSDAPTTSTDGTQVILTFSENLGSVDRTKITIGIGGGQRRGNERGESGWNQGRTRSQHRDRRHRDAHRGARRRRRPRRRQQRQPRRASDRRDQRDRQHHRAHGDRHRPDLHPHLRRLRPRRRCRGDGDLRRGGRHHRHPAAGAGL